MENENAENTGKKTGLKNLRPPWKPGEAVPGAGRPKGVKAWATVFKELLEMTPLEIKKSTGFEVPQNIAKNKLQYAIAMRAIESALKGDMRALEAITDRMDGKPGQPITVNKGENENLLPASDMPPQLRIELAREMIAEAEAEIAASEAAKEIDITPKVESIDEKFRSDGGGERGAEVTRECGSTVCGANEAAGIDAQSEV
jgi:hypothetical protein